MNTDTAHEVRDHRPPLDLIWGAKALAKELSVTRRRAFHLLEKELVPAQKVGGRWVVNRRDLDAKFGGSND